MVHHKNIMCFYDGPYTGSIGLDSRDGNTTGVVVKSKAKVSANDDTYLLAANA